MLHAMKANRLQLCVALLATAASSLVSAASPRRTLDLTGTWSVAEGSMEQARGAFDRKIPVPGLLDLAQPPFVDVGRASVHREAFWYRKTFVIDGALPEAAWLKIHKASYGAKVWLNGQLLGEHLPSFTPGWFDARRALKAGGQENELMIRVGAHRSSLPQDMPAGWDFEKYLFTPGLYDAVELILTGRPYIANVQAVPDIERGAVRLVAEIDPGPNLAPRTVWIEITEVRTGRLAATAQASFEPRSPASPNS